MVPETPLQFGVAERFSRTFRAESTGLRAEAPKMLWADSVSMTYLIYCIPYVPIGLRIPEEEWRGKDTSLAHLKVFGCDSFVKVKYVCGEAMKCTFIGNGSDEMSAADSNSLMKPIQKSQVVSVDIPEDLAENDNIVAEHGLSLEITQSPSGSSNTSEGSKNSRSFKDSGRLDEEYSEDGASSNEGGSETPHKNAINEEMVSHEKNQTCSLVRISAGKKASQSLWMFREPFYVGALNDTSTQYKNKGFQLAWQEENLECRLKKILYGLIQAPRDTKSSIHLEKNLKVGDEREVEVLRSFNWPPSELITEDGVLPERGYSWIPCIESLLALRLVGAACSVVQPQVNPDSTISQGRPIVVMGFRGGLLDANPIPHCLARGVQFGTGRAVWHDRAV
ncbi:hypothetical protein Tco_0321104 [Tanacetum coccineum]